MINGEDALEHSFLGQSATVAAELKFEEMEACVAMGISYETYVNDYVGSPIWVDETTPPLSKCDVIMWFRYHKMVPLVGEDLSNRAAQRGRR